MRTIALCCAAFTAAGLSAATQANTWRPAHTVLEPVCQATDWNQAGKLNAYVGADSFTYRGETHKGILGAVCGCDPLAWGQVVTYHAINHGAPAADWEPPAIAEDEAYVQLKSEKIPRALLPGPFDWEAVRVKATSPDGDIPVARLMWNLGILGHTEYAGDYGAAGTVGVGSVRGHFGFKDGLFYSTALEYGKVTDYWEDQLHRMLRCSLQAEAPLVVGVYVDSGGHVVVIDGWGVDAEGKEWFHVDYGWGSGNAANKWWDFEQCLSVLSEHRYLNVNVHPDDLGGIVAGRVADTTHAPVAGARVSLRGADGETLRETETDDAGCYVFTSLPRVDHTAYADPTQALPTASYTVAVTAEGFLAAARDVTLDPYIDDETRAAKNDAWEEKDKGKADEPPPTFPWAYGGTVADFTLEGEALCVSPEGAGDRSGDSWANAMAWAPEILGAVRPIRLAAGTYTLTAKLTLPAGATLLGGYDPATGARDPLASPSTLTASAPLSPMIAFGAGVTLDGLTLHGGDAVNWLILPDDDAKEASATLTGCVLSGGRNNYMAQNAALTCCLLLNAGAQALPGCTATHCSFVGTLGDGTDGGGNRTGVDPAAPRPDAALPCAADHVCPETGLDGRPLKKTLGALAPAASGYRLFLR